MRLLLDTHIFLWYITGDDRLSKSFRTSIENAEVVFVSAISLLGSHHQARLRKVAIARDALSVARHSAGDPRFCLNAG